MAEATTVVAARLIPCWVTFPNTFFPLSPMFSRVSSISVSCLTRNGWITTRYSCLEPYTTTHTHTHTHLTLPGLGAATCTYIIFVEDGSLILAWESWLPTKDIH